MRSGTLNICRLQATGKEAPLLGGRHMGVVASGVECSAAWCKSPCGQTTGMRQFVQPMLGEHAPSEQQLEG